MSYQIYKIIHIFGVVAIFSCLSAMALYSMNGGAKADNRFRKLVAATHGVGLLVVLVGGMGLGARVGALQGGFATWIYVKLVIWLVAGALMLIPYRFPRYSLGLWFGVPLLAALATWVVQYKTLF
jgi:hypothetical protein